MYYWINKSYTKVSCLKNIYIYTHRVKLVAVTLSGFEKCADLYMYNIYILYIYTIYSGILLTMKEKEILSFVTVGRPRGYYAKWTKSEGQIQYNFTYR